MFKRVSSENATTQPPFRRFGPLNSGALLWVLVCLGTLAAPCAAFGQARDVWQCKGGVYKVAVSPDGKTVAAVSLSGKRQVTLWDLASGKEIATLDEASVGLGDLLAFTPDGKSLVATLGRAVRDDDKKSDRLVGCAKVWDMQTRKLLSTIDFPAGSGGAGVLTPDGKTLIVQTVDAGGVKYDLASGKPVGTIDCTKQAKDPSSSTLSPDGKTLAIALKSGVVVLWDLEKNEFFRSIEASGEPIRALCFSADSKELAVAVSNKVELWRVVNGLHSGTLDVGLRGSGVDGVAYSPDGTTVAIVGRMVCVSLWDLQAGGERDDFAGNGYEGGITCVAFSPDGKTLVTGGKDHTIRIWDVPQGKPNGVKPRD